MYNKSAILEGKEITFTAKEQKDISKFHKSRVAFTQYQGKLLVNEFDEREHRVYCREDFGIDDELFETLIRGYIKPGRIVFYITSYHSKVPDERVDELMIRDAVILAKKHFGEGMYELWNGVIVGKPGDEWPPVSIIGNITVELK